MTHREFVLGALLALAAASPLHAGDIKAGKAKVILACAECHGLNGKSVVDNFPNLAGQKEMYIIAQLKAFRSGKRINNDMKFLVKLLSEADIDNVAAYYSSLSCAP